MRASLACGGEPLDLRRRRRPDRPMRLVCLLDVSESVEVRARMFLARVRGLPGVDDGARASLFHTRPTDAPPCIAARGVGDAAERVAWRHASARADAGTAAGA